MTEKNFCSHAETSCLGECPEDCNCPLDQEELPTKDRSKSRRRHHDDLKAKNDSKETLKIVLAKSEKLPDTATYEQKQKAEKKYKNVDKKIHSKKH